MDILMIIGALPRRTVNCKVLTPARSLEHAEASRAASLVSRQRRDWCARLALGVAAAILPVSALPARGADVPAGFRVEVVVTDIPRPLQLALDERGALVVLSQGWRGDAAGEIYRVDLRSSLPVDATRASRLVIPFPDEPRKTTLGSLAVESGTGDLFLGEENGNRIYRLGAGPRLQPMVVGLNHLLGGSAIALDPRGRLVFVDYASPEMHLRSEAPLPPSLSWLTEEGYRGPVVFRIGVHEERALPRRADLLVPILPHGETKVAEAPWRLIGVTAVGDDLAFLSAVGEVLRLGSDGELRLVARLPSGHYHRTNLTSGRDGSIYVCGGFHIRQIYRIRPTGEVRIVASELGDPGGIVVDGDALYVAETALHRVIRIVPVP
jgi:hypothetical protein